MIAFVAPGYLLRDIRRVDVERVWQDVGEDRLCTEPRHRASRREERKTRNDHLVSGPHLQRHERKQQRVAARGATDRVVDAAALGDGLFQGLAGRALHKGARNRTPR